MKSLQKTDKKSVCIVINPPHEAPTKTVIVLGVQRGGTSMAAGVLRALGLDMGKTGLNHEDARFLSRTDKQLAAVIAKRNAEHDVWGFKAPEVTLQLDYLAGAVRSPYYICVMRNITAVIDSVMQRRGGQADPRALMKRVLKYYTHIGKLVRETKDPLMLVNYERAAANPAEFVQALIDFVGFEPDAETREAAEKMITGDGGGYLNLAKEWFFVTAGGARPEDGVASEFKMAAASKGAVADIRAAGDFLPKAFVVALDGVPDGAPVHFSFLFEERYTHRLGFGATNTAGGVFTIETAGTAKGCLITPPKEVVSSARVAGLGAVAEESAA